MKLFVSDLDFTLLDTKGDLPKASATRLNNLLDLGMNFTVATARAAPSIKYLMQNVNLQLPIIELNGAIIRSFKDGHILQHRGLGIENAAKLFDCFTSLNLIPFVSGLSGDENPLYYPEFKNKGMRWFYDEKILRSDPRLVKLPDNLFSGAPVPSANGQNHSLDDVLCFVYIGTEQEIQAISQLVEEKLPHLLITSYPNHYTGGWEVVIAAKEANKGTAINSLLGHLHSSHGMKVRETTAFGDSSNDLEMLGMVDVPIAVSNASDAIKAKAKEVIGHHSKGSVLDYLELMHRAI